MPRASACVSRHYEVRDARPSPPLQIYMHKIVPTLQVYLHNEHADLYRRLQDDDMATTLSEMAFCEVSDITILYYLSVRLCHCLGFPFLPSNFVTKHLILINTFLSAISSVMRYRRLSVSART